MTTQTLRKGGNLTSLVAQYNRAHGTHFTVAQVAKLNHIKDPNKVFAGQRIHFADRYESSPKTSKVTPKTTPKTTNSKPNTVPTPTNPILEMKKQQQEQMNKLFPKEPFKLQPFKLNPNVKVRTTNPIVEMRKQQQEQMNKLFPKEPFKLEPFKLK